MAAAAATVAIALLLQAAVAGPVLRPPRAPAPASPGCGTPGSDGEIIVCARPGDDQRLKPLPDRYDADAPVLPKAQTRFIGKSAIGVEAEQAGVGGFTSNRAMVRVKVPF